MIEGHIIYKKIISIVYMVRQMINKNLMAC